MGYVICRLGSAFKNLLVSEFPTIWGHAKDALVYPTKGDAQRIRTRLGERTALMDTNTEMIDRLGSDR